MNKTQTVAKIKEILKKHNPGDYLKGEELIFVNELLSYHPKVKSKRLGDFCEIKIIIPNKQKWKCFSTDLETFSYKACLYPNSKHKQDLMSALRREIRSQVREVKNKAFGNKVKMRCPVTSYLCTREEVHVDHAEKSFHDIALEFLASNNLKVTDIKIDRKPAGIDLLHDRGLAELWFKYHKEKSTLIPIFHKENLWKGQNRSRTFTTTHHHGNEQ